MATLTSGGTLIFPTWYRSLPWGISEYSAVTQQPVHHLAPIASHRFVGAIPWANATGSVMIVVPAPSLPREQAGVLGHGRYLRLPGNNFNELEIVDPWSIAW